MKKTFNKVSSISYLHNPTNSVGRDMLKKSNTLMEKTTNRSSASSLHVNKEKFLKDNKVINSNFSKYLTKTPKKNR